MAFVVCASCVKCKEMGCLQVCPVASFHEGAERLVIDPKVCIDCGACAVECSHQAIFPDDEIPKRWKDDIVFNAQKAQLWPVIVEPKSI